MTDQRRPAVLHYHRPGPKGPAWYVVACHEWARRHPVAWMLLASGLVAVPLLIGAVLFYLMVSGAVK